MIELNEKQKHLAMMQASPSYRKSPEAFYLEMRALESVPEELPTLANGGLDIEDCIAVWSMRPQPGTSEGIAWVQGARQGWKWAVANITRGSMNHGGPK